MLCALSAGDRCGTYDARHTDSTTYAISHKSLCKNQAILSAAIKEKKKKTKPQLFINIIRKMKCFVYIKTKEKHFCSGRIFILYTVLTAAVEYVLFIVICKAQKLHRNLIV
jgi:hypothetical protein